MSLLRSLHTSPNTGAPKGREADSSLSDGREKKGVDTGTLERVADWSPDIVDAVDPCDPGTDPRNGPLAGIPHSGTFLPGLPR